MTSVKKTVGENLKKVCKIKGVKNIDIAAYMGVSTGCVSNWLRGTNSFDIDNLYKLCQYLDVSLDQIFGIKPIVVGILNSEENEVITAYRNASDDEKAMIRRALNLPDIKKDSLPEAK